MVRFVFYLIIFSTAFPLQGQKGQFPENKKKQVTEILQKYVELGIPGLAISVYNPGTGLWSHAEGLANKERDELLTTDHIFYLQSISKTYMAVAILQLCESGKLDLDDFITQYLHDSFTSSIKGAEKITVRMLLNHTSGLPEYNSNPELVSRIVLDPLQPLTVNELLTPIQGKPLDSEPGTLYSYRNTNYILLSLIADELTGNHVEYITENIFKKLGLKHTHYLTLQNYLEPINLVSAYWDILLEAKPVNISGMQRANVASMKGDDGIVASTADAIFFMKGLIEGKLLKPETLKLMQEWVLGEDGKPKYGLGLLYYDLDVTYAIGHSGGGIGAGCVLMYLPEFESIVFISTNFNTMMDSPIRRKAENLQTELLMALFSS